jgi:hypothetical protein
MKKRIPLLIAIAMMVLLPAQAMAAANQTITIPTFTITAVDEDTSVTISAVNFPPSDTFTVKMGAYGTLGIGGTVVGSQNSGTGSFSATYSIPASLVGSNKIAIRLQSPTSGYYSYNWFWNSDHPGGSPSPGSTPPPGSPGLPPGGAGTIPSTTITGATPDVDVTAKGSNFPTNDTLNVYIGHYGTKGVGGVLVGTQTTSGSGAFSGATYSIPAALHGESLLAIRWVSPSTGYYAYDWFNNASGGGSPSPGTWGYPPNGAATHPLTTVVGVVQSTSVTIHGTNFTTNDSYKVLIGEYGTLGVGGIQVASINTDGTGAFTTSFSIPVSLAGDSKLSIRFQSPAAGYYCYDWFTNTNYP